MTLNRELRYREWNGLYIVEDDGDTLYRGHDKWHAKRLVLEQLDNPGRLADRQLLAVLVALAVATVAVIGAIL